MAAASQSKIPRVSAVSVQAQAHASESWQLACEKLTLSLCRHNVCVIQRNAPQTEEVFDQVNNLLCGALEHPSSSSQPKNSEATEDNLGLLLQPGRHSYTFKLGSSKTAHLTPAQTTALTQVTTFFCNVVATV